MDKDQENGWQNKVNTSLWGFYRRTKWTRMRDQFRLVGKSPSKVIEYTNSHWKSLINLIFFFTKWTSGSITVKLCNNKEKKKIKVSTNKNWNQILQLGMKWFINWQLKLFEQFIIFKSTDEVIANPEEHRKKGLLTLSEHQDL